MLFNPVLVKLIAQLLMVKVVKPGVCQNFSQVDFTEQAQWHRVTGGGVRCLASKTGDQTGGFFTAAYRVNLFDKVDAPFAIERFQGTVAACCQC